MPAKRHVVRVTPARAASRKALRARAANVFSVGLVDEEKDSAPVIEDDEEIDEDGAFNPDDEALYGSLLPSRGRRGRHGTADADELAEPDADEDEDEDEVGHDGDGADGGDDDAVELSDILAAAAPAPAAPVPAVTPSARTKRARPVEMTESWAESEYRVQPGSKMSSTASTLAELMGSLEGVTGFGELKAQVSTLGKRARLLPTPLAPRLQERQQRVVAYEESKAALDKWLPVVQGNRRATHLSFPMDAPRLSAQTSAALVARFEPTTELERSVATILEDSGLQAVDKQLLKSRKKQKMPKLKVKQAADDRRAQSRPAVTADDASAAPAERPAPADQPVQTSTVSKAATASKGASASKAATASKSLATSVPAPADKPSSPALSRAAPGQSRAAPAPSRATPASSQPAQPPSAARPQPAMPPVAAKPPPPERLPPALVTPHDEPIPTFELSQHELVAQAFAADNVLVEDFEREKAALIEAEKPKDEDLTLPGWGAWGGEGARPLKRRFIVKAPVDGKPRADDRLKHVIINEKRNAKAAKFLVDEVPHPFETREQYERSLRKPLGKEWNAVHSYQRNIKPRVIVKQGAVIQPLQFSKRYLAKAADKAAAKSSASGKKLPPRRPFASKVSL